MTVAARALPRTLSTSFSFYVPASKPGLIAAAAELADGVTVRGANGPSVARQALGVDWAGSLLFDGAGYEEGAPRIDAKAWFDAQADAGADRLITPGRWVPWDGGGDALAQAIDAERNAGASSPGSTVLLAVDSRWLGRAARTVIDRLQDVGQPVALVLAHQGDPLSGTGVLDGLLALLRTQELTLLRSDHGAIGAVAFGAAHGSVGLRATYRHFVPQGAAARHNPKDRTPRVFVWDLLDWFTAAKIAGWGASSINFDCRFACCDGARIDRFLDPQFENQAEVHNRTTLAFLAEHILGDAPEGRRRSFARLCSAAVDRYGPMGKMSDLIEPKAQLLQWALWA